MSYAVIELAGSQFLVTEGSKLKVNRLGEAVGEGFSLKPLLVVGDDQAVLIGHPTVDSAEVKLEVLAEERARKVEILRFKSKSRHLRHQGHRQPISIVVVSEILTEGMPSKKKATVAEPQVGSVAADKIGDLELSTRVKNILAKSGLTKISDLKKLSKEELLEVKGVGEKAAEEIMTAVKK